MLDEISSKFDDHQFNEVKARSTTHGLVNILHICHQASDNQMIIRAVLIDVAKAFDHHIMLYKKAVLDVQSFIIRSTHSNFTKA